VRDAGRKASLVLVSESPVTLRGRGFRPAERVTVRLHAAGESYAKRLQASAAGVFTARFTAVVATECEPLSVIATGAAGSRATMARKIQVPPACGIATQP
jgi:hypothetical protein